MSFIDRQILSLIFGRLWKETIVRTVDSNCHGEMIY
ncbi:hypothetical protein N825_27060 [Skermanella stibiiresistens SB22]|uniref:Uncharacterized protein n=1 Tax=Skermanella stibiiresistens SB22 TaxID=1385369 RepID=W9GY48_9PROT|nr:hypothetical protein N825_27060 [Skermanella stibiiresistens SB22]